MTEIMAGLAGVSDGPDPEGEEDRTTGRAAVPAPRPRARARQALAAPPPAPPVPDFVSPLGGHPPTATHWGIKKRNSIGDWEDRTWAPAGSPVEVREWPVGELSVEALHDRWGPGTFVVQWIAAQERGGRRVLRGGREVVVRPRDVVAAAPASAAPKTLLDGPVGEALGMMKLIQGLAGESMANVLNVAGVLAASSGGRSSGLSGEELRAILRDEREAQSALLAASEARTSAAIAAAIAARDDDDDRGSGAAAAIGAAAPLITGKGFAAQAMRFAASQPELAGKVVDMVAAPLMGLAGQVIDMLKAQKRAGEPRPIAAPRAPQMATATATAPAPAPAPDPAPAVGPVISTASSLSSWPTGPGSASTNGAA